MNIKRIIYTISLALLLVNTSCKKDYSTIGNNMIEQPDFVGEKYEDATIITYDKAIDKVFSTNLPVHAFGFYHNDAFGDIKAELSTTILPDTQKFKPEGFGENVKILDAKIFIPFHSHTEKDNGVEEVVIDSIFGNKPFNVKVYELGYLLPSYDPDMNLEQQRKYYSDFDFTTNLLTKIADSVSFEPDFHPYFTYEREKDGSFKLDDQGNKIRKDSLSPHFAIKVDTSYIRQKIFDKSGQNVLTVNSDFKNYFRGLYFKAEEVNNDGRYMMMKLDKGEIFISYTHDVNNDNGTPNDTSDDFLEPKYEEMVLKFGSPKVNTYYNSPSADMQTALNNSDPVNGDDNIYLKGNAGSEAVVHAIDDQQLLNMKNNHWKINKAEIKFYVNDNITGQGKLPDNLILFDYVHHKLLAEMREQENIDNNNSIFGGKLEKDDNGNQYYKFNISRHIRNIVQNDSINVDLGLRVCPDPMITLNSGKLKDPDNYTPKGVVLYGNQSPVSDKRPKLTIYYTKPE